jgi:hypothetical protein
MGEKSMPPEIPETADDIDVAWLEQVFALGGRNVRLEGFSIEMISEGRGFAGEVYRLNLQAEAGGNAPKNIVLKLHSVDKSRAEQVLFAYRNEHRFYESFAQRTPVRAPHCYYGAVDETNNRFVLMLEDLHKVKFGDQVQGTVIEEIYAAVVGLAKHHAAFWKDDDVAALDRNQDDLEPKKMAPLLVALLEDAKQTFGKGLPLSLSIAGVIITAFNAPDFKVPEQQLPDPFTLTHTDYRLDNMGFDENGELVVIDWCCAPGKGHADLAYFLSGNMTPVQIETQWHETVSLYHSTLTENGVSDYSLAQLTADLRTHLVEQSILSVVTLGIFSRLNRDGSPGDLSVLPSGMQALLRNIIEDPRGFEIVMSMAERTEAALTKIMPGGAFGGSLLMGSLQGVLNLKARLRWK